MWSLSGAAAHLLAINPPCGNLAPVSARCGRSTKNTESATIALAVIMRIAWTLLLLRLKISAPYGPG